MEGKQIHTTSPSAPRAGSAAEHHDDYGFRKVVGDLPFVQPNVTVENEARDLERLINGGEFTSGSSALTCLFASTIIGIPYLCGKTTLVPEGSYGFSMNDGHVRFLVPGRHILANPLHKLMSVRPAYEKFIEVGPVTIVRVNEGELGMALDGARPQVLLPGTHIRNQGTFKFKDFFPVHRELIEFGPIKFMMVKSGHVRVCYNHGLVEIYHEGRYAINSGAFIISNTIDVTQQTLRFAKHHVLLDGGITLLVEGLLTYRVTCVESLIKHLGEQELKVAIEDVAKAELARVFSTIHLEQISSSSVTPLQPGFNTDDADNKDQPQSMLGQGNVNEQEGSSARNKICASVIDHIRPLVDQWGVTIINFQLESTTIADPKYAREYEEASLAMAKAKANFRAVGAESEIKLRKARADAEALKIEAEGKKAAQIIEARGRNEAAELMQDEFARRLQLAQQQVEFARALKATSLTVLPDSIVGRPLVHQLQNWSAIDNKAQ